ncbi:MAG: gamma-butyrobetaine hydroxylase-like domain-containing protein, partial [Ignavibacteriaceae bacterium]
MAPKQIKIEDKINLFIKWEDDSESRINLKYLRDECPCANC